MSALGLESKWGGWLSYLICSLTDFTLPLPEKSGSRFSFAVATQSRQAPGACKSEGGGAAAFGEWLRPFGMKIWNAGFCPCTCWMPHLQSAPEPHADTKTRLKADGAPFKRGTTKRGAPNYVSGARLWTITSSRSSVGMGKCRRYFLTGAVHWLARETVGVPREFAFLMNFSCELSS